MDPNRIITIYVSNINKSINLVLQINPCTTSVIDLKKIINKKIEGESHLFFNLIFKNEVLDSSETDLLRYDLNEEDRLFLVGRLNKEKVVLDELTRHSLIQGRCSNWEGVYFDENGKVVQLMCESRTTRRDLKIIPKEIEVFQHLEQLHIKVQVQNLPIEIGNFSKLSSLYLTGCDFANGVPLAIFKLKQLTKLAIMSCNVNSISPEIENLRNLEQILFHQNNIEDIQVLTKLENLKIISLAGNNIKSIGNICKLTKLQTLDLRCNHIEEIPEEIGDLTDLTALYLKKNQIKKIPESILKLTDKLMYLYISKNPIDLNQTLPVLEALDLSSLDLKFDDCFTELVNDEFVKIVDLSKKPFDQWIYPNLCDSERPKQLNLNELATPSKRHKGKWYCQHGVCLTTDLAKLAPKGIKDRANIKCKFLRDPDLYSDLIVYFLDGEGRL